MLLQYTEVSFTSEPSLQCCRAGSESHSWILECASKCSVGQWHLLRTFVARPISWDVQGLFVMGLAPTLFKSVMGNASMGCVLCRPAD